MPVSDNLRARIEPLARNGPVIHIQNPELYPDASALAAKLAIEWPRTFLRHSYISNRLPIVKSADAVALEAGNSPAIIFKHYWELATGDQPREWFGIHPWPKFRSLLEANHATVRVDGVFQRFFSTTFSTTLDRLGR